MSAGIESAVRAYQKVCTADFRDQLILDHLPFVRHILGRMLGALPEHVDNENLESAGILGLVEAAGQFDPERGTAFTTFAYRRIRGAIIDELRRNCPLPQKILRHWALIRSASRHMELPLTSEKLAATTGLTVRQVEHCLAAMRLTRAETWTDELMAESTLLARRREAGTETNHCEERELLTEAVSRLPDNQRIAIAMYHYEDMRMKEIGEAMGLSESRVSRLLADAELRLRSTVVRLMQEG